MIERKDYRGRFICEVCGDGVSAHRGTDNIHRCDSCFLGLNLVIR
jgi:ribosomal protein L37AE/L43A